MTDKVSVTRFNGNLKQSLRQGISLVDGLKEAKGPFLIKPNLCAETDAFGAATSSTTFLRAVVDIILEEDRKASVKIIESDSSGKWIAKAFENLGYMKLAEEYRQQGYNVSLINLSNESTTSLPLNGLHFKKLHLPTILTQPNFFISIAKTKTHILTHITGALKNQFGCLPDKNKTKYHKYIDEVIVDINKAVKPALNIIDAITGLEGITEGRIRKIGVILCGKQPASTDTVLARVMGFNPSKIRHITLAARHGLGELDPEVVGESVASVKVKFKKPESLVSTVGRHVPESLLPLARKIYEKIR